MREFERQMLKVADDMAGAMRIYQQVGRGQRQRVLPGQPSRALIHPRTGEEWTWPEADGTHADMAMALGLEPEDRYQRGGYAFT